jgi:hypothetical protein
VEATIEERQLAVEKLCSRRYLGMKNRELRIVRTPIIGDNSNNEVGSCGPSFTGIQVTLQMHVARDPCIP